MSAKLIESEVACTSILRKEEADMASTIASTVFRSACTEGISTSLLEEIGFANVKFLRVTDADDLQTNISALLQRLWSDFVLPVDI